MIILDIARLKNSPGAIEHLVGDFEMQPVQTEVEEIFFITPVKLDVSLVNHGSSIALMGSLEANIKLACGRCLEYFEMPVREEISEVYFNQSKQGDEGEMGEDWIPFKGDSLDITAEVAKTILSSLPMKLLCRDDCQGLCQNCGKNLNLEKCDCTVDDIDIRLVKLKQLLEKSQ